MTILSILIPTLLERKEQYLALTNDLMRQRNELQRLHPDLGHVEIISDNSPKFLDGGLSIGAKRNKLLEQATGRYVCFMDDDDNVAPNYLETLVRLCHEGNDCATFRVLFKNDFYWTVLNMSLKNKDEEAHPNSIIQRSVWHICPIKTLIAKKFSFDDKNHGEDVSFLGRVKTKLKTESHTDIILTQYNHSEKGSEADKIIQSGTYYPKGS